MVDFRRVWNCGGSEYGVEGGGEVGVERGEEEEEGVEGGGEGGEGGGGLRMCGGWWGLGVIGVCLVGGVGVCLCLFVPLHLRLSIMRFKPLITRALRPRSRSKCYPCSYDSEGLRPRDTGKYMYVFNSKT